MLSSITMTVLLKFPTLYKVFQRGGITVKLPYKAACERDLNTRISEDNWGIWTSRMLNVTYMAANFKMFSRWCMVPDELSKMYPDSSPLCFKGCGQV